MSWTVDLLEGLAEYLDAHDVGTWVPEGAYGPDDPWPLFLTKVPPTPDRVISMQDYPVYDDPDLSDSIVGVQFRIRGDKDPRTVQTASDALFITLHGLAGVDLNGVPLVLAYRNSGTPLAPDENGRHERTENYYLQVARPSANRPD